MGVIISGRRVDEMGGQKREMHGGIMGGSYDCCWWLFWL